MLLNCPSKGIIIFELSALNSNKFLEFKNRIFHHFVSLLHIRSAKESNTQTGQIHYEPDSDDDFDDEDPDEDLNI